MEEEQKSVDKIIQQYNRRIYSMVIDRIIDIRCAGLILPFLSAEQKRAGKLEHLSGDTIYAYQQVLSDLDRLMEEIPDTNQ